MKQKKVFDVQRKLLTELTWVLEWLFCGTVKYLFGILKTRPIIIYTVYEIMEVINAICKVVWWQCKNCFKNSNLKPKKWNFFKEIWQESS